MIANFTKVIDYIIFRITFKTACNLLNFLFNSFVVFSSWASRTARVL
jgi:hypothetical protein